MLHFIVCTLITGTPFIKDQNEIDEMEWLTLPQFFEKYDDTKIGHGLIYLRQHPEVWEEYAWKTVREKLSKSAGTLLDFYYGKIYIPNIQVCIWSNMVQAVVYLEDGVNRVLNIIKAKYGLKDKSEAISVAVQEYEQPS